MTSQSQQLGREELFYLESVRDKFVTVHNEMDLLQLISKITVFLKLPTSYFRKWVLLKTSMTLFS